MSTHYTTSEVGRILHLSGAALRTCFRAAGVPPRRPQCTFQDLLLLKTTKNLLQAKIPVARIRRILQSLKRQLPADQQLWNVTIYADGRRVVVWDGTAHWQPDSGQFLFNFEPRAVVKELALKSRPEKVRQKRRTAQQWIEIAAELESQSPEEACHAYREALALEPSRTDAHVNLGRLYSESQHWEQAEACYRTALSHAPDDIPARFNLAQLFYSRGQYAEAMAAYQAVLSRDAGCYEAHYNLALLYELNHRKADAIRHFSAAQQLLKSPNRPRARGRNRLGKPFPPHPSTS